MRVSQNEVYRLAQRALEAAGAAYGIDRDGADAVAWLAARGLPGVVLLAAALDGMAGAFEPLGAPGEKDGISVVDLAGRPAIAWAGTLVDCVDVLQGAGKALVLRGCRWPLFLLPLAVRRAERGHGLRLRWQVGEGAITCAADPTGACRIVGEGLAQGLDAALRDHAPAEVVVTGATSSARAMERVAAAEVIDAAALDMALQRSLADGIAVDAAAWAVVTEMAKRVLVPASEQSRRRGAGGGDANA